MKVIVDNKIPYIREVIEQLADEVVYLPGKAFTPEVVKDAHGQSVTGNCWKEATYGLSGQPPSASTTLIRHIASKPGLPGAIVPDAMRGL